MLEGLGIRKQFDQVVGFDQVQQPKPNPEIYLLAADKLGVSPGGCLVIEDSPVGVCAGVAAGMKVVAVPNHITETSLCDQDYLDQRWVVYDPETLAEVLRRMAEP